MKDEIKNVKTSSAFGLTYASVYCRFLSIYKTILSYCLRGRKNTESENPNVVKTKSGRIMLLSKCEVCDIKNPKLIKQQEASGLLLSLVKGHPQVKSL